MRSGCAGNAGEGGSSNSGRLLSEGFPLMCVLRDPIAGTRPFLWAFVLNSDLVMIARDKVGNVLLLLDKPGLCKVVLKMFYAA